MLSGFTFQPNPNNRIEILCIYCYLEKYSEPKKLIQMHTYLGDKATNHAGLGMNCWWTHNLGSDFDLYLFQIDFDNQKYPSNIPNHQLPVQPKFQLIW